MKQSELFARPVRGLRCLSLWQPWASFVMLGHKMNETRSWPTNYRGGLAIQAAKNRSGLAGADSILEEAGLYRTDWTKKGETNWYFGSIICVVELVDCVPTEKIRDGLSRQERAMGDYSDGRFAWLFKSIRRLKDVVPIRAYQGIFNLDPDMSEKVRRLI